MNIIDYEIRWLKHPELRLCKHSREWTEALGANTMFDSFKDAESVIDQYLSQHPEHEMQLCIGYYKSGVHIAQSIQPLIKKGH